MMRIMFFLATICSAGLVAPLYAAERGDAYNDALRDGVVFAQTQKWNVASDYWRKRIEEFSASDDVDKSDIAFLQIMETIALEKAGKGKAYKSWTGALNTYLESGTSWEREREALSAVIEKVKYDVGSSFSTDGVGIAGETRSALILESLDNILHFTNYDGPKPGLKVLAEEAAPNVSVSRNYFARPSAFFDAAPAAEETRSRGNVDTDVISDNASASSITRGIQSSNKSTAADLSPAALDTVDDEGYEILPLPSFDATAPSVDVAAHPSIPVKNAALAPISAYSEGADLITALDEEAVSNDQNPSPVKSQEEKPTVEKPLEEKAEAATAASTAPNSKLISRRVLSEANRELTDQELEYARRAWRYFEQNHQPNTGLYNSVHKYTFSTMWDVGSSLAALFCAYEIGIIDELYYDERMASMLNTLRDIPLYKGKLPNREYDTRTGLMTNLKNVVDDRGSGYSSLDIGRTLTWLAIIDQYHERFSEDINAVVDRWDLSAVLEDGEFYRDLVINGKTDRKQEGRIGYEQYAALGFSKWGKEATNAMDVEDASAEIVSGVEILRDTRAPDFLNLEPFLITLIEFAPVPSLVPEQASSLINAHIMRSKSIGKNILYTEDSIDESPWFLYNVISSPEGDWLCKTSSNKIADKCQTISTKAAFMANALFKLGYIEEILEESVGNFDLKNGYYAGVYDDGTLNRALTSNTNALILESLAFKVRGAAFLDSDYVESVAASKSRLAN